MIEEQTLPDDWSVVRFDEIIESSLYGCNPTYGEDVEGVPFLRISDITPDGKLKQQELPKKADVDREDAEKYGLEFGDVVVARSGSVGQSYVYNPQHGEMVYASYLIRFSLDVEQVFPKFIKMYFQSPMYWRQVHRNSRAATQPNLNAGEIKDFVVPLPPIDEQERIVSLLDDALASLDRVADLSEQVDDLADEFINAISHIQFEQSSTPSEWGSCELDEAVEYKSNLTTPNETPDQEFTLLDLEDVEPHTGRITGTKQVDGSEIGSSKREFGADDILYCKLRPYLNKVVCPDFEGVASSELLVLEPMDGFLKEYIAYFLRSPTVWRRAESLMKGANQPRINKTDLLSFILPKPPLDEQKGIVELLDGTTGSAGRAAANATQMDDYADELRESLLQQAFAGELLRD